IGTPGADDQKAKRALKKRGLDATLVNLGEKSTFSITPFLNRTKVIEDFDSPGEEVAREEETETKTGHGQPAPQGTAQPQEEVAVKPAKTRGRPRKVLGEVPAAKNATTVKRAGTKKGSKATLSEVTE